MRGDPRVLAPLQQAFKGTDDGRVQQQIVYAWCHETGDYNIYSVIESEIRAWTPPTDEPSLEQRVVELANEYREFHRQTVDVVSDLTSRFDQKVSVDRRQWDEIIKSLSRIRLLEQHPEPTAPDDQVCARFEKVARAVYSDWVASKSDWGSDELRAAIHECVDANDFDTVPAPQPTPDLDPVLLKIAEAFRNNDDWSSAGALRRSRLRAAWAAMLDLDNALVAKDMNEYGLKDGGA